MIYAIIVLGILLGANLGLSFYLRKKCLDIEELCLRIAAVASCSEKQAQERALNLDSKLSRLIDLLAAERDPDAPEADEKSEEARKAEKEFTDGVYNILNYSSRKGMGN